MKLITMTTLLIILLRYPIPGPPRTYTSKLGTTWLRRPRSNTWDAFIEGSPSRQPARYCCYQEDGIGPWYIHNEYKKELRGPFNTPYEAMDNSWE